MAKFEDLTGQRFGQLIALKRVANTTGNKPAWLCHCDCGIDKVISASHLRTGTQSCGCAHPNKKLDLTGTVIGDLTVLGPAENKGSQTAWVCSCICGKRIIMLTGSLRSGLNRSCGCYRNARLREANTTHGLSGKRLYKIWMGMKSRCYNPKNSAYSNYWIPKRDQSYNLRTNRMITWDGVTKSIHDWSVKTGLRISTIRGRLDILGWSVSDTLTRSAQAYKGRNI